MDDDLDDSQLDAWHKGAPIPTDPHGYFDVFAVVGATLAVVVAIVVAVAVLR